MEIFIFITSCPWHTNQLCIIWYNLVQFQQSLPYKVTNYKEEQTSVQRVESLTVNLNFHHQQQVFPAFLSFFSPTLPLPSLPVPPPSRWFPVRGSRGVTGRQCQSPAVFVPTLETSWTLSVSTFILMQVTFVAIMRIRSDIYQEGSFTEPWLTTGIMRAPAQECCLHSIFEQW